MGRPSSADFQAASVSSITRRPQIAGEPTGSLPRMALIKWVAGSLPLGISSAVGVNRLPSGPHTAYCPLRKKNTPGSQQIVISSCQVGALPTTDILAKAPPEKRNERAELMSTG